MHKKALEKIELDKVLKRLANACVSILGRELVWNLTPSSELETVKKRLQETTEASAILRLFPVVPFDVIPDLRPYLWKCARGIRMETEELLAIAMFLAGVRRMCLFLEELKGEFPLIRKAGHRLKSLRRVEEEIKWAINEDGVVVDRASPELASLRRQITVTEERIKNKLEKTLYSSYYEKILQDRLITIRNGRYVLPVKQEFRSRLPGLVHDQSASGATVFVEPMPVVELNNELRRLQAAEKQEVEAILLSLTEACAQEVDIIQSNLEIMSWLDFVLAKGRLSREMEASEPKLNNCGWMYLHGARHPLLTGEVVPITVELGRAYDVLIITGPNTGGKTVSLKTIGLLAAMAQCGLHVPAEPDSELCLFENIFADIGDEQSIEQSLSTFSSHMRNIIEIVKKAHYHSLVLLDELGVGTDPSEGAALAMAILDYLQRCGAKVVATTHYGRLKSYAYTKPRVENAGVEFDLETLKPTYRLLVGIPGRSNAFEVAQKLGLPPEIIEQGRQLMPENDQETGNLIAGLVEERRKINLEMDEIRNTKEELQKQVEKQQREYQEMAKKKRKIVYEAYEEAQNILEEARREAKRITETLSSLLQEVNNKERERAIQEAREALSHTEKRLLQNIQVLEPESEGEQPKSVRPGQQVYIPKLNQKGTIITAPNAQQEVQVQVGAIKANLKLPDLRSVGEGETNTTKPKDRSVGLVGLPNKSREISPQLDLRGQRASTAIELVDKYLDDVLLTGLSQVSIIHGKGTGALRLAVGKFLSEHQRVKNFRSGSEGEGGLGVTIVEL